MRGEGGHLRAHRAEGDTHVGNRDDARGRGVSARGALRRGRGSREGRRTTARWATSTATLRVARRRRSASLGPVDGEPRRATGRTRPPPPPRRSRSASSPDADPARASRASRPAHHRGEVVALVDGVRFVDNSKATNVHAALAAIDGRRGRGPDRRRARQGRGPVAAARRAPTGSRAVVAIGESARRLAADRSTGWSRCAEAATIEEATAEAFALAPRPGTRAARAGLRQLGHVPRTTRSGATGSPPRPAR